MVNILFCGNDKVFDGMLTCALSILKRSDSREPYTFYIFTMDVSHIKESYLPVSERQMAFFEQVIRAYNPENRAISVDVTDLYLREFGGSPNEDAYCSPYTLIRLLADQAEGLPDKILYLDVDVMFNRDIHLLYDMDVEGYEYAAARDHYGKYLIRPNYINAGVLLFNMKEMRQTGILAKARDLIREKKLVFADQSALIRSTTRKRCFRRSSTIRSFSTSTPSFVTFPSACSGCPIPTPITSSSGGSVMYTRSFITIALTIYCTNISI